MTFLGETLFQWRSSGPNLLIGAAATLFVVVVGYLFCRTPKGRVAGIILFGAWAVFIPALFIGLKIWPDEVAVTSEGLHGRNQFSRFSVNAADISSIRGSHMGKGGYHLSVTLKSKNESVEIPVIWDQDKEAYKTALHQLSPNADLNW
jgi:hypothetical protein